MALIKDVETLIYAEADKFAGTGRFTIPFIPKDTDISEWDSHSPLRSDRFPYSVFYLERFPGQCGMKILHSIYFQGYYINGRLGMKKKDIEKYKEETLKIVKAFLNGAKQSDKWLALSKLKNVAKVGKYVMSDASGSGSLVKTLAEQLKLEHTSVTKNPNTGNAITVWTYDMEEELKIENIYDPYWE